MHCVCVVHKAIYILRKGIPRKRLHRPCCTKEAKWKFYGIHSLVCCYLDVVREPVCLNELVSDRWRLMLLVGLTKPERLQGKRQTKRSIWS